MPEPIKDYKGKLLNYYDAKLAERFGFYLKQFESARDQRSQGRKEFDDRNYETDYIFNQDAMNSYLRKKNNTSETRVVTGVTEKKIEVVVNELLSLNFQTIIDAFDYDDNELQHLGREMQSIIRRTNQIELEDDMMVDAIQELLSQRALFIEELFVNKTVKDKRRQPDGSYEKKEYTISRAEKRVLSGLQVYLGNIHLPAYLFQNQPFTIKYERMSYREAQTIYGEWDNWKYVKPGMGTSDYYDGAFDYRFAKNIDNDEVEILHYQSYPDDEYQIIINSVMMCEADTPLPWEKEGYNISMTVLKPMRRAFAYGKPLTASAKALQTLSDESIRLMVRKFQQSLEPPKAYGGSKVLSRSMFDPGKVTYGVKKDKIESLIDHQGVTTSEMAFYDKIEEKTKEFIGQGNLGQGMTESTKMTATEVSILQKNAIKMLGMAVYAMMKMRREMDTMRLYTVLENYTVSKGKTYDDLQERVVDIYHKFTLKEVPLDNNKIGKKIIQFNNRDLTPKEEEDIHSFEKEQEVRGKNIRIKFINVEKLRTIRTIWYFNVTSEVKDTSALHRMQFTDKLSQAVQIQQITQTPLNPTKIVEDFEKTWDAEDYFILENPEMQNPDMNPDNILKKLEEMANNTEDGTKSAMGSTMQPSIQMPTPMTPQGSVL